MVKELKIQTKVEVGIHLLWKAFAKDLKLIMPKMLPQFVKDAQVIEGDGGLGTVFLFNFQPGIPMKYQKEKISEIDESIHRLGVQVIEGGRLDLGFSYYNTIFHLTPNGEGQTLLDITIQYEPSIDLDDSFPSKTTSDALGFIKTLENYLLNVA